MTVCLPAVELWADQDFRSRGIVRSRSYIAGFDDPAKAGKEHSKMDDRRQTNQGYVLAAAIGAVAGGIFVAAVTKAIPKMMSGMMQGMMARMRESGCDPAEM